MACSSDNREGGDGEWSGRVRLLVDGELRRCGLSCHDLAQRLRTKGIADYDAQCLEEMIARGDLSAAFLIQVLWVLECDAVAIGWLRKSGKDEDGRG